MDTLRYYIDGPGEVLIVDSRFDFTEPDVNKIIAVITCKSANIAASADMEDVTGGRSLFPKRRYKTGQSASLELTDCEMDFRYNALTAGEDVVVGASEVWAFGTDYRYTIPSATTYTVTLPETPTTGTLVVRRLDTGALMTLATETVATGTYTLADKVMTFAAADAGVSIETMFKYTTAATARSVDFKIDSLPKTVSAIHKQPCFDADNNVIGYQIIEFFKLQPSSELNEDYQEKAAYAPVVKFELIDPQRADKLVYKKTFVPVAAE